MDFVDDIDLVTRRDCAIAHPFDDLTCIINAGMAGCVNFQNINMPPDGNRLTGLAAAAGLQRFDACPIGTDAVQPARQQACCRGLADTAHSCQHKCMRQTPERQCIAERADQRFLADQFGKPLWPVGACKDAISCLDALGHDVEKPSAMCPAWPLRKRWKWMAVRYKAEDWTTRIKPALAASFRI